jgi:hypothetical protein
MRSVIILSFLMSVLTLNSCGSSGGGGGGGSPNNNKPGGDGSGNGEGSRPLTDAECTAAWQSYVRSHPRGLKLRYENRSMGSTTVDSTEVTESGDNAVTEKFESGGQTNSETTTKKEFLDGCKSVSGNPEEPVDGSVEARRKETKTVRAGTFSTDYIRIRATQSSDGDSITVVTESWTNADQSAPYVIYSKSVTSMGSYTMESSRELIAITRP